MSIFIGSATALVTPFSKDGSINFDVFGELIDFQLENQTDALVVCGTTGEASTLTDDEQIECIRFAVDRVKKRVPILAGAGSNYTDHGIELCVASQRAGADACLLVTPYYNKTTEKGLIEHYTQTAKAVDLPIVLYNVPSRTGLNITPKVAYELSKIENIVAIKEASGNLSQVAEIAHLCGDKLDIYSGNDDQIMPIMALGGKGVVSVLSNVAPKNTHDMVMHFLNGNVKKAIQMQLDAIPLINALFCEVNPIPVKAALNIMGKAVGGYRRPLTTMEDAHLKLLEKAIANYAFHTI